MFIEAPGEGNSTCRSKRSKRSNGELVERTYDYVVASQSLQVKIKNMEVVDNAVRFRVERETKKSRKCVS